MSEQILVKLREAIERYKDTLAFQSIISAEAWGSEPPNTTEHG